MAGISIAVVIHSLDPLECIDECRRCLSGVGSREREKILIKIYYANSSVFANRSVDQSFHRFDPTGVFEAEWGREQNLYGNSIARDLLSHSLFTRLIPHYSFSCSIDLTPQGFLRRNGRGTKISIALPIQSLDPLQDRGRGHGDSIHMAGISIRICYGIYYRSPCPVD